MTLNFRETKPEDLEYMEGHSISRGIQKSCPERIDYRYTLEDNGVPLGVGGFQLINLTTAWCFCDMADSGKVIIAYRTLKEWIEVFVKEHKLKRIQAYVLCDFPEAISMVKHLGFEEESVMKNFIGDKDAFMYIRIF